MQTYLQFHEKTLPPTNRPAIKRLVVTPYYKPSPPATPDLRARTLAALFVSPLLVGPGEYTVYGSLGEQKESTRTSYKGFGFGGSGVTRDMALPTR